jgi:hypothetical protein
MNNPAHLLLAKAAGSGLPLLLVGGHAVIHYGVPRFTRDLDLLIPDSHVDPWIDFALSLEFRAEHRSPSFIQFTGPDTFSHIPLDLMVVDSRTWDLLTAQAQPATLGNCSIRVPSPEHLLAMKLQAARAPTRLDPAIDWSDARELVRLCSLDLDNPVIQAIVDRYGGPPAWTHLKKINPA